MQLTRCSCGAITLFSALTKIYAEEKGLLPQQPRSPFQYLHTPNRLHKMCSSMLCTAESLINHTYLLLAFVQSFSKYISIKEHLHVQMQRATPDGQGVGVAIADLMCTLWPTKQKFVAQSAYKSSTLATDTVDCSSHLYKPTGSCVQCVSLETA